MKSGKGLTRGSQPLTMSYMWITLNFKHPYRDYFPQARCRSCNMKFDSSVIDDEGICKYCKKS